MSDSATAETAAHQAPPSLGFSRQEHWSGLPFPSPMHESEKWKWSRSVVSDSDDLMDCSLPGSSVHGIFQAKVLEWGAIAFSEYLSTWILKQTILMYNCEHLRIITFFFFCCWKNISSNIVPTSHFRGPQRVSSGLGWSLDFWVMLYLTLLLHRRTEGLRWWSKTHIFWAFLWDPIIYQAT